MSLRQTGNHVTTDMFHNRAHVHLSFFADCPLVTPYFFGKMGVVVVSGEIPDAAGNGLFISISLRQCRLTFQRGTAK